MTHPLAGPIYTTPPAPERCTQCSRSKSDMRLVTSGIQECVHLECPNRRQPTAQPMSPYFRAQHHD